MYICIIIIFFKQLNYITESISIHDLSSTTISNSSSSTQHYNESKPKLFGIFATHSPESCPMNNQISKKIFMQIEDKIRSNFEKYSIKDIVGFYMSVLEHQWIIIVSAQDVHESPCALKQGFSLTIL